MGFDSLSVGRSMGIPYHFVSDAPGNTQATPTSASAASAAPAATGDSTNLSVTPDPTNQTSSDQQSDAQISNTINQQLAQNPSNADALSVFDSIVGLDAGNAAHSGEQAGSNPGTNTRDTFSPADQSQYDSGASQAKADKAAGLPNAKAGFGDGPSTADNAYNHGYNEAYNGDKGSSTDLGHGKLSTNPKEDRQFGFDEAKLKNQLKDLESQKQSDPANAAQYTKKEHDLLDSFKHNVDQRQAERTSGSGQPYSPSQGNPFADNAQSTGGSTNSATDQARALLAEDQKHGTVGTSENERTFGLESSRSLDRLQKLQDDKANHPANAQSDTQDQQAELDQLRKLIDQHDKNQLG